MKEIIDFIRERAERPARNDNKDFMAYDYAGGNIDDAYSYGMEDGEVWFAREILKKFDFEYKIKKEEI